jgi:16S rRNA A1518/A1519 N6-dimethyltransferase RsmA/KsgA/DIM1 with predicted DNA glycosylase/AP lyase activity
LEYLGGEDAEIVATFYMLENDDVVLEIGENIGRVTCIVASRLKNKGENLVSVEPNNNVYSKLCERRKDNNLYTMERMKFLLNKLKITEKIQTTLNTRLKI